MEKGIPCLLTYGIFLSALSQCLLLLMLVYWFCFPGARNSHLGYLVTTVSWGICESICLLIFREVKGNGGGPGSWFLGRDWGENGLQQELHLSYGRWQQVSLSPFFCWVPWQELDSLLLDKWSCRQGMLLRSRMTTEQGCVCMELGKDCVGLNSLWSSQAFYLWLLKASRASLLCICYSIYVASQTA